MACSIIVVKVLMFAFPCSHYLAMPICCLKQHADCNYFEQPPHCRQILDLRIFISCLHIHPCKWSLLANNIVMKTRWSGKKRLYYHIYTSMCRLSHASFKDCPADHCKWCRYKTLFGRHATGNSCTTNTHFISSSSSLFLTSVVSCSHWLKMPIYCCRHRHHRRFFHASAVWRCPKLPLL